MFGELLLLFSSILLAIISHFLIFSTSSRLFCNYKKCAAGLSFDLRFVGAIDCFRSFALLFFCYLWHNFQENCNGVDFLHAISFKLAAYFWIHIKFSLISRKTNEKCNDGSMEMNISLLKSENKYENIHCILNFITAYSNLNRFNLSFDTKNGAPIPWNNEIQWIQFSIPLCFVFVMFCTHVFYLYTNLFTAKKRATNHKHHKMDMRFIHYFENDDLDESWNRHACSRNSF